MRLYSNVFYNWLRMGKVTPLIFGSLISFWYYFHVEQFKLLFFGGIIIIFFSKFCLNEIKAINLSGSVHQHS